MDRLFLLTRPKYNLGTEYLSAYASSLIKNAENLGFKIKDFQGENATKAQLTKYLSIKNPSLVFLNGHGNEKEIYGQKDEILFSQDNSFLLKNKIVYARACLAAISLGKNIVAGSEGCFIGYRQPFSFWTSDRWSTKPLNDKIASLYLTPSNEIINILLRGKTSGEAHRISKKMMVDNMKKILRMKEKNQPGATTMLQILWGNYEGQVLLGRKDKRIEAR